MGRRFIPARFSPGVVPQTVNYPYTAAQTFLDGAVLIFAAAGTVEEGGADPTPIVGIAQEPAASKPGFGIGHSPTVVTGRVAEVAVAMANRTTTFSGAGSTAYAVTDNDTVFGVVKTGNDWLIDKADTTNTRLEIVDGDLVNDIHFFKFMEAHLAIP